jgi:ABC-type antimicrobial peptide transport system permease subunit
VKAAFGEIDPRISFSLTTMSRRLENHVRLPRTLGLLSGFFGGLALLLAAIGLYGIVAYTVARRRTEIGIRLALGATGERIARLILQDVARMVLVGLVIGVGASLVATRLATSVLYGVTPNDPITFLTAMALLAAVGLLAGRFPHAERRDSTGVGAAGGVSDGANAGGR